MKKEMDTIPELHEKIQQLEKEITRLQVEKQDLTGENTRIKNELKENNLPGVRDIANQITSSLITREPVNLTEEQIAVFKAIIGEEVIDQWRNKKADAEQEKLLMNAGNSFSPDSQQKVTRLTTTNKGEINDLWLDQ